MSRRLALIILDGRGIPTSDKHISANHPDYTPFLTTLESRYPHSQLEASGKAVGLPEGQMGNSEVGHMTLGAGRVLEQYIELINTSIESKEFFNNEEIQQALHYAKENKKSIHIMGLCSDGGVHSHINHFKALADMLYMKSCEKVFFHLFTDGRDTAPTSGLAYIKDFQDYITSKTGKIVSIIGRFYAMDRDNRRERIQEAYDLLVHGKGSPAEHIDQAYDLINQSYEAGITDEFLKGISINYEGRIKEGDVVIFANFRSDRGRELTQALTQEPNKAMMESGLFGEHTMHAIPNLFYLTMVPYDEQFKNVKVIMQRKKISDTLGEHIARSGKSQSRIAETEKYPHVTFFFSGGQEDNYPTESRHLIPSPKDIATYDLKPEMGTKEIAQAVVDVMKEEQKDLLIVNFAAPDMVGHTGDYEATKIACQHVDEALRKIYAISQSHQYDLLIIADHGNVDVMMNADNSPNTQHSLALVPCIYVSSDTSIHFLLNNGTLADIAPTILDLMEIEKPEAMTGHSLIEKVA